MGIKRTVMAGLIFAASVALLIQDAHRIERAKEQSVIASRILPVPIEEITEISIRREGFDLELTKEKGDTWQISRPATPADPQTVQDLLQYLDLQTRASALDVTPEALEDYGLKFPSLHADFDTAQGQTVLGLLIGNDTPVSGEVYARLAGSEGVFTISSHLRDRLARPLYDFRDKRLLTLNATEATTLSLTIDAVKSEMARNDSGWHLFRPIQGPADQEKIATILRELHMTRAVDFIDTDTLERDRYGLSANPMVVVIEVAQGDRARHEMLLVGRRRIGKEPTYYAMREGWDQVFTIPQTLESALRPALNDLRSKQLFTLVLDEVASMTLSFGANPFTLVKNDAGQWSYADEPDAKLDQQFTKMMVAKLLSLRVTGFLDVPPLPDRSGLDDPLLGIAISDVSGERREAIETGKSLPRGKNAYARMRGQREIFLLDGSIPGLFFLSREDFADKMLFDFNPKFVHRVEIIDEGKYVGYEREEDYWLGDVGIGAEPFQISSTRIEKFILNMRALKWNGWLDPDRQFDNVRIMQNGLLAPERTIVFRDQAGNELAYLGQGKYESRYVYLRLRGERAFYTADSNKYANFDRALVNLIPTR